MDSVHAYGRIPVTTRLPSPVRRRTTSIMWLYCLYCIIGIVVLFNIFIVRLLLCWAGGQEYQPVNTRGRVPDGRHRPTCLSRFAARARTSSKRSGRHASMTAQIVSGSSSGAVFYTGQPADVASLSAPGEGDPTPLWRRPLDAAAAAARGGCCCRNRISLPRKPL